MSAVNGRLSVLIPVKPRSREDLAKELRKMDGELSPLAGVEDTHVARFAFVDRLDSEPPTDDTSYLLFSSWFDRDDDEYDRGDDKYLRNLYAVRRKLNPIWRTCFGYDEEFSLDDFQRWMLAHRIEVGFAFDDHQLTVDEARRYLALREQVAAFAVRAQAEEWSAEELRREWRAAPFESTG
jgi:hypothetical protein